MADDEHFSVTSFSEITYKFDNLPSHELDLELRGLDAEEEGGPVEKRFLYTIDEESEQTRPTGLVRSRTLENLESAGYNSDEEIPNTLVSTMSRDSPSDPLDNPGRSRDALEAPGEMSPSSSEDSLIMFPSINDDIVDNFYSVSSQRYLQNQVTCDEVRCEDFTCEGVACEGVTCKEVRCNSLGVQCEIISIDSGCPNCKILENEVDLLKKLLKKARSEVDYLNDEFSILSMHKCRNGTTCNGYMGRSVSDNGERSALDIASMYVRSMMDNAWTYSRDFIQRFFNT